MVWAAFSLLGKVGRHFHLILLSVGANPDNLLRFKCRFYRLPVVCQQQDKATEHVSASARLWLGLCKVETLEWPASSPDLNPMESHWPTSMFGKCTLYASNRQYLSVEALKEALLEVCDGISDQVLQNIVT